MTEARAVLRRGLYAITPDEPCTETLLAKVEAVLQASPVLLQYRNKSASTTLRRAQAEALNERCRRAHVPLIINDDAELAGQVGAAGVHLGASDGRWQAARALLGDQAIIGVSCYADLPLARQAQAFGADYVAFGSVFASTTKPDAPRASLALLNAAAGELALPVCAIGGIDRRNAVSLINVGVDLLAVISDLFAVTDSAQAAREWRQLCAISALRRGSAAG